jgi:hypothetical protein
MFHLTLALLNLGTWCLLGREGISSTSSLSHPHIELLMMRLAWCNKISFICHDDPSWFSNINWGGTFLNNGFIIVLASVLYFVHGFMLPSFRLWHEGRDVSDILGFYGVWSVTESLLIHVARTEKINYWMRKPTCRRSPSTMVVSWVSCCERETTFPNAWAGSTQMHKRLFTGYLWMSGTRVPVYSSLEKEESLKYLLKECKICFTRNKNSLNEELRSFFFLNR